MFLEYYACILSAKLWFAKYKRVLNDIQSKTHKKKLNKGNRQVVRRKPGSLEDLFLRWKWVLCVCMGMELAA